MIRENRKTVFLNFICRKIIRKSRIPFFSLLAFGLLFLLSCEENPLLYRKIVYLDYTVCYEVEGNVPTAYVDVLNANAEHVVMPTVELPWTYSFTSCEDTEVAMIVRGNAAWGSDVRITARILVDDEIFQQNSSDIYSGFTALNGTIRGWRYSTIVEEEYKQ